MPCALVTGIGGQDGSLLAELLLERGYRVVGTASGPGVESDRQETTFRIAAAGPQVRARILLDAATALPGAEVTGTIQGSNGSGAAVPARIVLTGGNRPGTVTVAAADVTLAAGASETGCASETGRRSRGGGTTRLRRFCSSRQRRKRIATARLR